MNEFSNINLDYKHEHINIIYLWPIKISYLSPTSCKKYYVTAIQTIMHLDKISLSCTISKSHRDSTLVTLRFQDLNCRHECQKVVEPSNLDHHALPMPSIDGGYHVKIIKSVLIFMYAIF